MIIFRNQSYTMKYTIFSSFINSFYNSVNISVIYDNIKILALEGHEITYVYCDGKCFSKCRSNMTGNQQVCKYCKLYRNIFHRRLPHNIKFLPVSKFQDAIERFDIPDFHSIQELKQIEYKNVKIGYAVISSYLTLSRNLNPLFDETFIKYMDECLTLSQQYTDVVRQIIVDTKPDVVACFNARHFETRPIIDSSIDLGIPHLSYEITFNENSQPVKTTFHTTPHNVIENTQIINNLWDSDFLPTEEKIKIAQQFFFKRKNSIPSGDKLYVKDQKTGLLPDNFDKSKHNILILNSSEDEFASLGEEFENNTFFPSQLDGIKYFIDKYKSLPDYHFFLRVHPNLKNVKYQYHTKLYELFNNIDNFTIIPADSPISTYAMIDNCNKVVVFGSTTGPEAAYWGRPVILLSYCIYSLLDICYTPKTFEELDQLVLDKNLPKKDIIGTLKYGYYRLNNEYESYTYFPYQIKRINFFDKHFDITLYPFNWLSKLYAVIIQMLGKRVLYTCYSYPQKEQIE